MTKNEVCIFVEKEICSTIDYRWSKITMGSEYKFSKVLKSSNEYSIQRMKSFISFERIQQVHEKNTKGSCICINGMYRSHREIYFDLVKDYLKKLENDVIKVSVFIQGKDGTPYQIVEQQKELEKIRLENERMSSNKLITDAFISQVDHLDPYLQEVEKEMSQERQLNVNITFSIYSHFSITRTYSIILVQDNLGCLIKYWKDQISSRLTMIFRNTLEQSKTIVSFLNDQNKKDLPNYFQQLSQIQDEKLDYYASSYIKSNNKLIRTNILSYKDEISSKDPQTHKRSVSFNQGQAQSKISKQEPLSLKSKSKEMLVQNPGIHNQIKYDHGQIEKISKQPKSPLLSQQIKSDNRFTTPKQTFNEKSSGKQARTAIINSNHRKSNSKEYQRIIRDIIQRIDNIVKEESQKQILMIQICKDPLQIEILTDTASKKFDIQRANVNLKLKVQLIDAIFDSRQTKIILKKGNCDSDEQQKKFKTYICNCMDSSLKYFHLIQGKLPKEFFQESQKKRKMSKKESKSKYQCQIS